MDMSQYLDMFLEESFENLQNLSEGILALEKVPNDKETINSIFRAAHTLKGMAGSMGFNEIAELTHSMENIFDKSRNGGLLIDSNIINILFKCLDTLENMINNIRDGRIGNINHAEIINSLNTIEVNKDSILEYSTKTFLELELNEYDLSIVRQALSKDYNVLRVDVKLINNCILKSARAFLVYKSLEDLGEVIKSVPSVEDLEQEKFDNFFSIMIITQKTSEYVEKVIEGISEIDRVSVTQVKLNEESLPESSDNTYEKVVAESRTTEDNFNLPMVKEKREDEKKVHHSVRVDIERLDKLMNLVGELVIHRTRLEQISSSHKLNDLNETLEQVGRITSDLQDLVMKVRMFPVERVFNRFPRMVRDLSKELNKDIELIIEGEDTELDRTVIDEIGEPLVHLIRNSVDHGIEPSEERIKNGKNSKGIVRLTAYQEGNKVVIRIDDDGRGLNIEKIRKKARDLGIDTEGMTESDVKNLIFLQGFSTSDQITDVSGRGVGMDVVKTKITSIGGVIDVVSEFGKGTSFIIRLPLTLSIIQALLVKVGDESFAISLGFIDRVIDIDINNIMLTNKREVILYGGNIVPIMRLSNILNIDDSNTKEKYAVIIKVGEKTIGLLVDSLLGQQEIVIKPLGKTLQNLNKYVGATILGDGLVTLILDVASF